MVLSRLLGRARTGRQDVIDRPFLPYGCTERIRRHHPSLGDDDVARVESGLRDWFAVCAATGGRQVAMPSPVVDDLWHEFLLFTRDYASFCDAAFGRFLHHTPTEAMTQDEYDGQAVALRTTYEAALLRHRGAGLPALFCLDAQLGLPGAPRYVEHCGALAGCTANGAVCLAHLPRPQPSDDDGAVAWGAADGGSDGGWSPWSGWGGGDTGGGGGCSGGGGGGCGGGGGS